jgi:phosphoribosylamine--glycine ligase
VKVLLVGGGGREHALGWKIAQSPILTRLYVAPGNPGLKPLGETLPVAADDIAGLDAAARALRIDLVVVGPEAPLAQGLADRLAEWGCPCFGPSKAAARLESSKSFMKEVAAAAGAPTAAYGRFRDVAAAREFLRAQRPPFVVKADGLAAGKGVIISDALADAEAAVAAMLGGAFGAAGREILIEDHLEGEEVSFFAVADGTNVRPFGAAQDHKRAFDGDAGPNTGGMGAYSPAPAFTTEIEAETMTRIIRPTLAEMSRRGAPFVGVLFAGLMLCSDGPKLLEFNVRFGDPECQTLMRRVHSDILPLLHAAATGALDKAEIVWSGEAAATVVLATRGYPGDYIKGSRIAGVDAAQRRPGVVVFHAGTEERDGVLRAVGGRALNVTATGANLDQAVQRAYAAVDDIDWPEGFWRTDIGRRAPRGRR